MKKNFWIIEATVIKKFKVEFAEEFTMAEAADMFMMQEDISDIIDESEIEEVVSIESLE